MKEERTGTDTRGMDGVLGFMFIDGDELFGSLGKGFRETNGHDKAFADFFQNVMMGSIGPKTKPRSTDMSLESLLHHRQVQVMITLMEQFANDLAEHKGALQELTKKNQQLEERLGMARAEYAHELDNSVRLNETLDIANERIIRLQEKVDSVIESKRRVGRKYGLALKKVEQTAAALAGIGSKETKPQLQERIKKAKEILSAPNDVLSQGDQKSPDSEETRE